METSKHSDRLAECWRIQDCGSCLNSKHGCGWCPTSSTCIPASSLLQPLSTPICPLESERYELRTRALGCNCSTTTLLSIIVTVFATIAALALLYLLIKAGVWALRIWGPGAWNGWEIEVDGEGKVREGVWVRRRFGRAGGKEGEMERTGLLANEG